MPNYIRSRVDGGIYFFTVVTHRRRRIFHDRAARRLLSRAMRTVRRETPWQTLAIVLPPDHLHTIWQLPDGDSDYSTRLARVKKDFTSAYLKAGFAPGRSTEGQKRKGHRGVWQERFWEHTVRNARDLKMHLDYIHVNPVKHALTASPADWPWSSCHRYVKLGEYQADWCGNIDLPGQVEYFWHD